jgi:hypothetical protein
MDLMAGAVEEGVEVPVLPLSIPPQPGLLFFLYPFRNDLSGWGSGLVHLHHLLPGVYRSHLSFLLDNRPLRLLLDNGLALLLRLDNSPHLFWTDLWGACGGPYSVVYQPARTLLRPPGRYNRWALVHPLPPWLRIGLNLTSNPFVGIASYRNSRLRDDRIPLLILQYCGGSGVAFRSLDRHSYSGFSLR